MLFDILVILALILLNGFFAMAEMALVSVRKPRLTIKAEAGSRGAKSALVLVDDPATFLASVQIGITLIGVLSGAYSGATLAEPLGDYLSYQLGFATHGDDVAIALVVIVVTYLSLIIGELVPKQLALKYADSIACFVAPIISLLAMLTRPLVFVLDQSNRLVLRLLGAREEIGNTVTEEEVKAIIAEGTDSGALESEEREILERVMRLDDFPISAAMTHRNDIVWLDVNEPIDSVLEKVRKTRHSHYLVCEGSIEHLVGLVVVKDILLQVGLSDVLDLRVIARKPMCLPDTASILDVIEEFKQSTSSFALLVDDYGSLQGIVTLKDLMEAMIGALPEPAHREDFMGIEREDGGWLLDGGLSILETEELLSVTGMVEEGETINTLAGFILAHSKNIPKAGDYFTWRNLRFEVVDMDRNRVDKVLVIAV